MDKLWPGVTRRAVALPRPAWSGALVAALAWHGALCGLLLQALVPPSARVPVAGRPSPVTVLRLELSPSAAGPEAPREVPAAERPAPPSHVGRGSGTQRPVDVDRTEVGAAAQPAPSRGAAVAPADGGRPPEVERQAPATADDPPGPVAAAPDVETLRALPDYAVRLPPPFVAALRARRGDAEATGSWRFDRHADGRFQVTLEVQARARPWLSLDTQGVLAPSGLQPQRHEDLRRGRRAAVNLDAASGLVRFSGLPQPVAAAQAVQDRLSLLLQLSGILAARPALACAGMRIWLHVVGVRGSSAIWRFEARGTVDDDDLAAGRLWHLVREPEQPYDSRVEVWFERDAPHRPRRLRLTPVPAGPVWDLRWQLPADAAAPGADRVGAPASDDGCDAGSAPRSSRLGP